MACQAFPILCTELDQFGLPAIPIQPLYTENRTKVVSSMIQGMYSAASALDVATQRQEVAAENLAHLSTPGYRGRSITFESFDSALDQAGAPSRSISGVRASAPHANFQPGAIRATGGAYHLALDGDAFFALGGPKGTVYTRNGSFHLGSGGQLLSDGNYPVLGNNGPIQIPTEATQVSIGHDGSITADGVPVDTLRLTKFANPQQLTPVGPTLFAATTKAGASPGQADVRQGYLEGSNIAPANAMIELIQSARFFEAAQRAMRAISDSLQLNTRPNA
jgi:flagellar basal-body rod protein FlgF/flagellar basal-body rod protein FlgG